MWKNTLIYPAALLQGTYSFTLSFLQAVWGCNIQTKGRSENCYQSQHQNPAKHLSGLRNHWWQTKPQHYWLVTFFWFILVVRMVNISISRKFQSQNQDLKPRSQVANMTPVEMRSTKRDLEFNEISERSTLEKKSHVKPKRPRNSIQSNHPFSGGEFLQLTRAPTKSCKKIFGVPIKTSGKSGAFPKKFRKLIWTLLVEKLFLLIFGSSNSSLASAARALASRK